MSPVDLPRLRWPIAPPGSGDTSTAPDVARRCPPVARPASGHPTVDPKVELVGLNQSGVLERRTLVRALLASPLLVPLAGLAGCGNPRPADEGLHPDPTADLLVARSNEPRAAPSSGFAEGAAESLSHFGGRLVQALAPKTPSENLIVSPYSVAAALTMTRLGAVGETAAAMDEALSVPPPPPGARVAGPGLAPGMNSLGQQLATASANRVTWSDANSLWGQRGVAWESGFLDSVARWFGTGMHESDFAGAPEQARGNINRWTEDRTAGKIPEILAAGMVSANTRLVLVNAVHFKAPWATPFIENATRTARFTRLDGRAVDAEMMTGARGTGFHDSARGCSVVTVTFQGGDFGFTAVLPDAGREAAAHAWLTSGDAAMREVLVPRVPASRQMRPPAMLEMPRFSLRYSAELTPALTALGMGIAFGGGADFSGMSASERLSIGLVAHQATLDVDEKGAEAAAATAVVMEMSGGGLHVALDRPFYVVLHDTATNSPLFFGYVADPTAT